VLSEAALFVAAHETASTPSRMFAQFRPALREAVGADEARTLFARLDDAA